MRTPRAAPGPPPPAGSLRSRMSKLKAEAKALDKPLPGGGEAGVDGQGRTAARRLDPRPAGVLREPRRKASRPCACSASERRSSRWWLVPVPAYLITHPTVGPILVDTAFHGSVAAKPSANLGKLVARFAKPRIEPGRDLPAQLRERGIDALDLETVILTHLHFDHSSGIAEYPKATFVVSKARVGGGDDRPAAVPARLPPLPLRLPLRLPDGRLRRSGDHLLRELRPHLRPVRRRQRPARLHARPHRPVTAR